MGTTQYIVKSIETLEQALSVQMALKDGAIHAVTLRFVESFFGVVVEAAFQYLQGQGREILDYKPAMGHPNVVNLIITYR